MTKRPLAPILIGVLLILMGAGGLVQHLGQLRTQLYDAMWVCLLSLAAVIAGAGLLRGYNWARWLALAWIAFHVAISFFHSWLQVGFHIVVCALFAYFLFRPGREG